MSLKDLALFFFALTSSCDHVSFVLSCLMSKILIILFDCELHEGSVCFALSLYSQCLIQNHVYNRHLINIWEIN